MPKFFVEYILSALSIFLSGLMTWLTTVAIKWLNSKIKNKKLATFAETIVTIATRSVKATYQTYVESLKGTDAWTEEAQKEALRKTLETTKKELPAGAFAYIKKEQGEVDEYLINLIESILYDLKNKPAKEKPEQQVENQATDKVKRMGFLCLSFHHKYNSPFIYITHFLIFTTFTTMVKLLSKG